MPKLLMLLPNPDDSTKIRIDRETKGILAAIAHSQPFDFTCKQIPAVALEELPGLLLSERPEMLHFSGHGHNGLLCFEDRFGNTKVANQEALELIIAEAGNKVTCLMLNACSSKSLAEIASKYIPYVIGYPDVIEDEYAAIFSQVFYQSLSYGQTVKSAFNLAIATIIPSIPKECLPVLFTNDSLYGFRESVFCPPVLKAEFELNGKGKPAMSGESYWLKIYVDHIPRTTSYILYEFVDDSIEDEDRFVLTQDLSAGSFIRWKLYGNIIVRYWLWKDEKKQGVGLECTVLQAINNHYGEYVPEVLKTAFEQISEY